MKVVNDATFCSRIMTKFGHIFNVIKELTTGSHQMVATHSRKSAAASFGEFIVFFVLVPALLFSMLVQMGEGGAYLIFQGKQLALAATAEDYLRLFPDGDISYQLKFAVDYVRDGSIAAWVLNLWPPGMPGLYILILKLSGLGSFPLKIITLATLFYSLASCLVYRSLARGQFSPSLLVICTLPLMCLTFQNSIFLQINLFSSDFYCFALLAILLSLIFKDGAKPVRRLTLMAIVLAALAYFRSFYFIFIKLLTVGSLFTLVAWGLWTMASRGWRATIKGVVQSKAVASVGVVLLLTWVFLLPWMVILKIEGKPFEWTVTDQAWAGQWRNDLPPFLVGMNTPCILEKDICDQLMPFQYQDIWATPKLGSDFYKRLSIATFVSSPLKWYREKAKWFDHFWFDDYEIYQKKPASQLTRYIQSVGYLQSAGLLAVCLGLALLAVVRFVRNVSRRRPLLEDNGLYFLFLIFCIYNVMVFTFVHFEPRYSVPLKWVTYLFSMFLLKDVMHKIDLRLFGNNTQRGTQ